MSSDSLQRSNSLFIFELSLHLHNAACGSGSSLSKFFTSVVEGQAMGYWNKSYAIKNLIGLFSTAWKPLSHSDDLFIFGAEMYQPMLCGYPRRLQVLQHQVYISPHVSNGFKLHQNVPYIFDSAGGFWAPHIAKSWDQDDICPEQHHISCKSKPVHSLGGILLSIEERSLGHRGVDACLNSNCIKANTVNIFC